MKRLVLLIAGRNREVEKLGQMLEENGYGVVLAADGDEAVRLVEEQIPEVVLLEIQSEDLKGLDILQRLKKKGGTRDLPVILLLEKFDEEYVAHGLEAGAADYLLIPFQREEVLRRVGVLTRVRRHEKRQRGLFSLMKKTEFIGERYEKVQPLGVGSYGEIWKVRDSEGDRAYCVAKIPKGKKLNPQIEREAAICRRLQGHPNAVRVIDVVMDCGRAVLVQEYVEGPTLKELMERSLEAADKERIVLQLVDVVAHAHRHRIVHRDIKPENIIVRRDGTVKLLDYGVAKELKDKDISTTMVGSRPFMAPEQIMGESQIASDVWALGVIIYGIYTEYLPFYHDNEKVLMDIILTREPELPRDIEPGIPPELENIMLRCLKKNPGERFPDAGALREALLEQFPHFGKK
jgi:CheY-like chemotaxis protein